MNVWTMYMITRATKTKRKSVCTDDAALKLVRADMIRPSFNDE